MQGRDALWQPRPDIGGIATQMVLKRLFGQQGNADRRATGRDAFALRGTARGTGGRIGPGTSSRLHADQVSS